ncbi:hypothetical protein UCCLB95_2082 [Levilactobacillus brevis]|uniref:hypothetical protein n=1 Tax=Levilactobacillus brevis TaxID=1580 RepID=UPI000B362CDF|nr:hypothetical protein [Levilactobacillus brevis]QCZ49296.1 hypothetical protein UCCLB95_2082 [Levilactobacillus brevis]
MQKSLKNSLYLGLAVLSLGTVTVVSTTANAAAKTKVTSDVTLKTAAESRNVEATGTNALYSKPGTVKGAKLVASKTTMKKMANSKKSADYFRAYRVAKTTRGTVYYKMVSMDGKYRGYVYGGRSVKAFAGGIKKAATTKSATMPSTTTMYFKTPGKSNVSWTAPNNTQYKASKVVKDTTTYANDALVVTDAARKTREGSLYYYVTDAAHPEVNGWVYAKGLTTTKPTTDNFNDKTDVKVNLKNVDGVVIKTAILSKLDANGGTTSTATGTAVGDSAKKQANDAWGKTVLTGTGYKYASADSSNVSALTNAKTGDTITLIVTKNEVVDTPITFYATTNSSDLSQAATELKAYKEGTTTAASDTVVFPSVSATFSGTKDASFTAGDLVAYLTTSKLNVLDTPNYNKAGSSDKYYTEYTLVSALPGTYGTTTKAFYVASEKTGNSPVSTPVVSGTTGYYTNK